VAGIANWSTYMNSNPITSFRRNGDDNLLWFRKI